MQKNKIWCIITEDFKFKTGLFNTSILIDRAGKIKGRYKKINLYAERGVNSGNKIHVFNTDFGKIGIAICWDLAFSEIFLKMKKAGAQIVFCPVQWAYEEKAYNKKHKEKELKLLKSLLRVRAFENLFFVGLCSPFRNQKDLLCYSAIVSPHKILAEILDEEGIIYSDLRIREIGRLKKIYPGK